MAKKIKTGSLELPDSEFDEENATAHISIRLPLPLLKSLRRLALTEKHGGKYQVLIRDVLSEFVAAQKPPARRRRRVG